MHPLKRGVKSARRLVYWDMRSIQSKNTKKIEDGDDLRYM